MSLLAVRQRQTGKPHYHFCTAFHSWRAMQVGDFCLDVCSCRYRNAIRGRDRKYRLQIHPGITGRYRGQQFYRYSLALGDAHLAGAILRRGFTALELRFIGGEMKTQNEYGRGGSDSHY